MIDIPDLRLKTDFQISNTQIPRVEYPIDWSYTMNQDYSEKSDSIRILITELQYLRRSLYSSQLLIDELRRRVATLENAS